MRLAQQAGLDVAPIKMARSLGKDVLLIERFDRMKTADGWGRHIVLSALTLLGLGRDDGPLCQVMKISPIESDLKFNQPGKTLVELFSRIVFNVLCGIPTTMHVIMLPFWDGMHYRLTPAYDICPQSRTGGEATQAMLLYDQERRSQLIHCLEPQKRLGLSRTAGP